MNRAMGWHPAYFIIAVAGLALTLMLITASCRRPSPTPSDLPSDLSALYEQAVTLHLEGRLREAGDLYAQVLAADPPQEAPADERNRAFRFAPRLFTTPTEPFALMDVVAILHPEQPLIAYHLFWEDDIDYPDDQEPCDHEVVWVAYDPAQDELTAVYTYYHGRILSNPVALTKATEHDSRPWIGIQWGKHGSLPYGWESLHGGEVRYNMRRTYRRLSTKGHRLRDHPLATDWPVTFDGTWEDFVDFSRPLESRDWLSKDRRVWVSRWGNAVLDQYVLRYNFHPKPDWPR